MCSIEVSKGPEQLQVYFAQCTMINITNNHRVKNRFHRMEEKGLDSGRLLLRRTKRKQREPRREMDVIDFAALD